MNTNHEYDWDVFISHASEDRDAFVRPLSDELSTRGLRVWFDDFTLHVGDSLRKSIDIGLARSRYGVVVLSQNFLAKEWPQIELNALVAREIDGKKVILPVWHNLDAHELLHHSPILADRIATTSDRGLKCVVADLLAAMNVKDRVVTDAHAAEVDSVDRRMLSILYENFQFHEFRLTSVYECINVSERFLNRFDRFIQWGYVDRFLDKVHKDKIFRLNPAIDYEGLGVFLSRKND